MPSEADGGAKATAMQLMAAVDVLQGGAVRLTQGDFGRRSEYGDPVALACRWAEGGAPWVHVVDLDAARTGEPVNRPVILAVAAAVAPVPVQVGGGVRQARDVEELLGGGVSRVVLGTAAARQPQLAVALATEFPGQVAVGIDHRHGRVAVSGWESSGASSVDDLLESLAGAPLAAVVVTNIERDGMLTGPDTDGLAAVLARTAHPVVASGGVASTGDLHSLGGLTVDGRRLWGVIVGKALVDDRVEIGEAVAACAAFG